MHPDRTRVIICLAALCAALLLLGGCMEPVVLRQGGERVEGAQPQPVAQDIDSVLRQLSALDQRMVSLEREVELSAQRSLSNQSMIKELGAKLSAAERKSSGAVSSAVETAVSPGRELSREEHYLSAYRKYLSNEYAEAIKLFAGYLAHYPRSRLADNALYWIGEAYYMLEDIPRAIDHLNRVTREYPHAGRVPYALYRLGLIYDELGDPASARTHFSSLIERYPGSDPARLASLKVDNLKEEEAE